MPLSKPPRDVSGPHHGGMVLNYARQALRPIGCAFGHYNFISESTTRPRPPNIFRLRPTVHSCPPDPPGPFRLSDIPTSTQPPPRRLSVPSPHRGLCRSGRRTTTTADHLPPKCAHFPAAAAAARPSSPHLGAPLLSDSVADTLSVLFLNLGGTSEVGGS